MLVSLILFAVPLLLVRSALFSNLNWLILIIQAGMMGIVTKLVYLFIGVIRNKRASVLTKGKELILRTVSG